MGGVHSVALANGRGYVVMNEGWRERDEATLDSVCNCFCG
jgi:hypothetical protein